MKLCVWSMVACLLASGAGRLVAADTAAEPAADPPAAQQVQPAPQQPAAEPPPATSEQSVADLPVADQPAAPPTTVSPAQQAAADALARPALITNSIGMHLVLIPAGEFSLGSPASETGREGDEHPHRVRITQPYYLGIHEVTQKQYEAVMSAKPSRANQPLHPVDTVRWTDAAEFCDKLTALPDEQAAGRVYRLPTEAEWEYACRAGSTTSFTFGDQPDTLGDYAWFLGNSSDATHPVGEKLPNAWGLLDMHGNVREWCADWYDANYYANSPAEDPRGPATGTDRVTRGGNWFSPAPTCRSADRDGRLPSVRNSGLGLRVAASIANPVSLGQATN